MQVALDLARAAKYNRIKDGWFESTCQDLLTSAAQSIAKLVTTTRIVKSILPVAPKGAALP